MSKIIQIKPKKNEPFVNESIFLNIDQFESKRNENVKNSLSVFMHIMQEIEIFKSCIDLPDPTKHEEIKINKETAELIKEMNMSDKLKDFLEEKIKSYITEREKLSNPEQIKYPKSYLFCKEHGSNLAVSEYFNSFNQKDIRNTNDERGYFFSKESEVDLFKEMVKNKLKSSLKTKLEIYFNEKLETELVDKFLYDEKDAQQFVSRNKLKEPQNSNSKIVPDSERKKIIKDSIMRLYPIKAPEEKLTDQYCIDKINEFNRNGEYLTKKVDINKLITDMKFPFSEDDQVNMESKIELTNDVISAYLKNKEDKKLDNDKNKDKNKFFILTFKLIG